MNSPDRPSGKPFVEPLTRREREILGLLAEGFSAPEIADQLSLAVSSVKSHIQHLYGKLDVRSKRQALTRAQALGLLEAAAGTPSPAAPPTQPAAITSAPVEKPAPPSLTNLPLQATAFVGRERELAALADLLANPACRLVTLVGPGGSGKTRLAIQAASAQQGAFSEGVVLVSLAPVSSPESLAGAISDALKVPLAGGEDPQTALLGYLGAKKMLLVLDNCEHLLAGAGLFGEILRGAPGITLLATSRERLNLAGEWLFEVEGLPVPEQWRAGEAVGAAGLFMQSARRLRAGFAPSETDKAAVVHICQLVGGMPLAVELAAAWVRMLSCAEIAAEIEGSLAILAAESRDLPTRQQSMQAIYDHSWRLLSPEEQRVFPRLSVFRSGFQREAAEQVGQAGLRMLSALVDKSLVRANPNGRYELHELARQYAAEKLQAAGEVEATARRHLAYCVALAEQAAPELTGPRQAAWLDCLEAEHDNLRAALAWCQAEGETEMGLRLAGSVWRFWFLRGHLLEGEQWLQRMLELPDGAPLLRACALVGAGFIAAFRGNYKRAADWGVESLALAREAGDMRLAALSLSLLGDPNLADQDTWAAAHLADGLAAARLSGDRWMVAFALAQMAQYPQNQAEATAQAILAAESVALARVIGDRWLLAFSLYRLGRLAAFRQDFRLARALHEEGLAIRRGLGDRLGMAYALLGLGEAANAAGDFAEANSRMEERLAVERALGNREGVVYSLANMGRMNFQRGNFAQATLLFEESLALCREYGLTAAAAIVFNSLGLLAWAQGDAARARAILDQNLATVDRQADKTAAYISLNELFDISIAQGNFEQASREAIAIPAIGHQQRETAVSHFRLGQVDYLQGLLAKARQKFEMALAEFRDLNDHNGMGWVPPWLGCVAYHLGDLEEARTRIEEGLAIHDPDGVWSELAYALLCRGDVARAQGEPAEAARYYARSLTMVVTHRFQPSVPPYLEAFARLAIGVAQPARAARLLGAAHALREAMDTPVPPVEQAECDRALAEASSLLDPAAFSAAWAEGQALDWQQAAAYALETQPDP